MFDLVLIQGYSARQVARVARDEWALRTPKRKRTGGTLIAPASVHRILTNPFYAGFLTSKGVVSPGKHEPVLSLEEFDRVQAHLGRAGVTKPQRQSFAFTGLIRCGACNRLITAEHKVNRHGTHYTYYHCAGRSRLAGCLEPSVEHEALKGQLRAFVERLRLHHEIEPWVWDELARDDEERAARGRAVHLSLRSSLAAVETELRELTGLRTRQLIDDAEFIATRATLQDEAERLRARLGQQQPADAFEPVQELISFSVLAADLFDHVDDDDRRLIIRTTCSNPLLSNKILSISAAKPFVEVAELVDCLEMRGRVDNSRTLSHEFISDLRERAKHVASLLQEKEFEHILPNIRQLRIRSQEREEHRQLELPLAA
jgi:hypothetical protein